MLSSATRRRATGMSTTRMLRAETSTNAAQSRHSSAKDDHRAHLSISRLSGLSSDDCLQPMLADKQASTFNNRCPSTAPSRAATHFICDVRCAPSFRFGFRACAVALPGADTDRAGADVALSSDGGDSSCAGTAASCADRAV